MTELHICLQRQYCKCAVSVRVPGAEGELNKGPLRKDRQRFRNHEGQHRAPGIRTAGRRCHPWTRRGRMGWHYQNPEAEMADWRRRPKTTWDFLVLNLRQRRKEAKGMKPPAPSPPSLQPLPCSQDWTYKEFRGRSSQWWRPGASKQVL